MTQAENPGAPWSGVSRTSVDDMRGSNRAEIISPDYREQPAANFSGLRHVRDAAMAGSYIRMAYLHVPHDVAVEQAVIGAILADNQALERAGVALTTDHFHDPLHSRIFETMAHMIQRGEAATPITVNASMK